MLITICQWQWYGLISIKPIKEIKTNLIWLQTSFNTRFKNFPEKNLGWIKNQFSFNTDEINKGNFKTSEELIELSSDENVCDEFRISIKPEQ